MLFFGLCGAETRANHPLAVPRRDGKKTHGVARKNPGWLKKKTAPNCAAAREARTKGGRSISTVAWDFRFCYELRILVGAVNEVSRAIVCSPRLAGFRGLFVVNDNAEHRKRYL